MHRHGRAVVLAAAALGLAIVGFGLAARCGSRCMSRVAGAMDSISGLFRGRCGTRRSRTSLRGRLAGIEMLSWSSGPTLGGAEAGAVASLAGVRASVVIGGVLCVAGTAALVFAATALLALRRPDRGRRSDDDGGPGADAILPPAHGPAPAPR